MGFAPALQRGSLVAVEQVELVSRIHLGFKLHQGLADQVSEGLLDPRILGCVFNLGISLSDALGPIDIYLNEFGFPAEVDPIVPGIQLGDAVELRAGSTAGA
ncbi:hypothetical protein [Halomonas tibetensis]|uniref:Uncharacterized protein n=1 Tax=Halomonas tibetensis TaxID=2259590 RepID=A0ABV7B6T7_9GAMM